MSHIRFRALAALGLTVMLAACSTDNDLVAKPNLKSQFGTANEDIGLSVATVSTGRIYTLASEKVEVFDEYGNEQVDNQIFLKRLDASGNTVWTRSLVTSSHYCDYICTGSTFEKHSLIADTKGNINAFTQWNYYDGDMYSWDTIEIDRYSASGGIASTFYLYATNFRSSDFAVGAGGNFFVVYNKFDLYDPYTGEGEEASVIANYTPNGSLLWQRTSTVDIPYSITVTGAGNIYVIGSKGMARYSSAGNLIWTKTGTSYAVSEASKIVPSGSNLYVSIPKIKTIRKYDANGKLLWSKPQSGLTSIVLGDISADGNGNVYLAGKYQKSAGQWDVFSRKLSASGAPIWTKTFGTPQYDDGRGIATINGSEIYLTGETQGSLAHTNIGGRDGYLRKLNSLGNPVWTR